MKEELKRHGEELTSDYLDLIVDLAKRQAALVQELKAAVEANDTERIVEAAKRICSIDDREIGGTAKH